MISIQFDKISEEVKKLNKSMQVDDPCLMIWKVNYCQSFK